MSRVQKALPAGALFIASEFVLTVFLDKFFEVVYSRLYFFARVRLGNGHTVGHTLEHPHAGMYVAALFYRVLNALERLVGGEFAKTECPFRKFADVDEVVAEIERDRPEGYYILIKGSHSTRLYELPKLL